MPNILLAYFYYVFIIIITAISSKGLKLQSEAVYGFDVFLEFSDTPIVPLTVIVTTI